MKARTAPKSERQKVAEFMNEFAPEAIRVSTTLQSDTYMTAREEIMNAITKATEHMTCADFTRLMKWLERQAARYQKLDGTPEP
jgi:hypothetical protein